VLTWPFVLLFRQFVDDDLGCGSYLVGDSESGEALVVDPPFAVEPVVEAAEESNLRIERVLETHNHADHLSGHGRLALEQEAVVSIHSLAAAEYPHEELADGDVVQVGSSSVRVIHTPGHRPEHCAFLVDERVLLTGDSLFAGDAARPDLAVEAREGAESLFHSLRRLKELPDDVEVYPGHVAGSLCGTSMSSDRSTSIGRERHTNPMLAFTQVQEFVMRSASSSAPRPPTTELLVALNCGPWVARPDPVARVETPGDAIVLDVRPLADFAAGHLPGALSVPVDGGTFGTKAAFVLDPDEPVVLHARSDEEAQLAGRRLWAVGFLRPAGYVVDLPAPETLATIDLAELKRMIDQDAVVVLDVREIDERDEGYIPGSRHIPYRLLRRSGADALNATKPIVTICSTGARAAIAASVLAREGFDARPVIDGGVQDFDGQTVTFRRCGSS
jgi:glyoxylase-like metal-dependent hydrolase (beta-lactamase superfamily II)/rhodanese-related sulfurtransferase